MMKILTAEQMAAVDRESTEISGVPSLTLMENAGFQLFLLLRDEFDDLTERRIAIFCGKGNNGGDGMVLARQLFQRGIVPDVYLLTRRGQVVGDAAVNLTILLRSGCPIIEIDHDEAWEQVVTGLDGYDIIVDGILGTGITKPLSGLYGRIIADLNETDAFILAVDVPTGIIADSVEIPHLCSFADATVTFTAPKIAHALSNSIEAFGQLTVVPIGTPTTLLDKPEFWLNLIMREDARESWLPRPASSHKGTYGHIAVVAGSLGKSGAAALSSLAALRTGSGLVTVVAPAAVQGTIAAFRPEIMTEGFPSTESGTFAREAAEGVLALLERMDAAALGPGVTTHPETVEFVHSVIRSSPVPLVIDADGLNAISERPETLSNRPEHPLILTPHPGEFERLSGRPSAEILRQPHRAARDYAMQHGVWLVLKNFRTLVAAPDGQVFVSPTGNPGMATAGMGDVLTGVLASVLGRYRAEGVNEPHQLTRALSFGVFLHGMAGDLAADLRGIDALVAGDVIDALSRAFGDLLEENPA